MHRLLTSPPRFDREPVKLGNSLHYLSTLLLHTRSALQLTKGLDTWQVSAATLVCIRLELPSIP